MSFSDRHGGAGKSLARRLSEQPSSEQLDDLMGKVSRGIYKIGTDVEEIKNLSAKLGKREGSAAEELEAELRDLQKEARERIRATAQDLKELVLLEGACVTLEPQRRLQRQRLSTDFGDLLKAFERVEKATAKKERELVNKTRATVEEKSAALIQLEDDAGYSRGALPLQPSSQVQRQQQMDLAIEIETNEQLIAQREKGIEEIEQTIVEINELFRDLATMVHEQGFMLDNIEYNIVSAASHVEQGAHEVSRAQDYQKRSSRRLLCIFYLAMSILTLLILIVVVAKAL